MADIGDEYKDLVFKRTGLTPNELVCPREKTEMTPCVARDGDIAMLEDKRCVGCLAKVEYLLTIEKQKHG